MADRLRIVVIGLPELGYLLEAGDPHGADVVTIPRGSDVGAVLADKARGASRETLLFVVADTGDQAVNRLADTLARAGFRGVVLAGLPGASGTFASHENLQVLPAPFSANDVLAALSALPGDVPFFLPVEDGDRTFPELAPVSDARGAVAASANGRRERNGVLFPRRQTPDDDPLGPPVQVLPLPPLPAPPPPPGPAPVLAPLADAPRSDPIPPAPRMVPPPPAGVTPIFATPPGASPEPPLPDSPHIEAEPVVAAGKSPSEPMAAEPSEPVAVEPSQSQPIAAGPSEPVVVERSLSELAVESSERVVVEPSEPVSLEPSEPVVVEPSEPVVVEPSEPVVVERSLSELAVESSERVVVEPSEPVSLEPTEPVVVEPSEPAAVESSERVVVEPSEPVVVEPSEPVVVERSLSELAVESSERVVVEPSEPVSVEPSEPVSVERSLSDRLAVEASQRVAEPRAPEAGGSVAVESSLSEPMAADPSEPAGVQSSLSESSLSELVSVESSELVSVESGELVSVELGGPVSVELGEPAVVEPWLSALAAVEPSEPGAVDRAPSEPSPIESSRAGLPGAAAVEPGTVGEVEWPPPAPPAPPAPSVPPVPPAASVPLPPAPPVTPGPVVGPAPGQAQPQPAQPAMYVVPQPGQQPAEAVGGVDEVPGWAQLPPAPVSAPAAAAVRAERAAPCGPCAASVPATVPGAGALWVATPRLPAYEDEPVMPGARLPAPGRARAQRRGDVISVCSYKGGSGKTTTAVLAAAVLARAVRPGGKRVALVDANTAQSSVATVLQRPGRGSIVDLVRTDVDEDMLAHALTPIPEAGDLDVLFGAPDLRCADERLLTPTLWRRVVAALRRTHDYVIVDTPVAEAVGHELFDDFVLRDSSLLLVVLDPNRETIHNNVEWLDIIGDPVSAGGRNFPPDRVAIVLNRADPQLVWNEVSVGDHFRRYQFLGAIPHSMAVQQAADDARLTQRFDATVDQAVRHMLGALLQEPLLDADAPAGATGSLLDRLLERLFGRRAARSECSPA